MKRLICFATALIGLLWLVFLYYSIRYDAKIEFLFPSLHADWIVQNSPRINFRRVPISDEVIFRRRFPLPQTPEKCKAHITAMRGFSLSVNGIPAFNSGDPGTDNWKAATDFDLLPYLQQGENIIDVYVHNPGGPPALLFKGSAQVNASAGQKEHSVSLDSGQNWEVSVAGADDWESAGIAGKWTINSPRIAVKILFGAYLLFILLALTPVSLKEQLKLKSVFYGKSSEENQQPAGKEATFLRRNWLIIIIFVVMIGLNIHNAARYPSLRGLDADGHIEYAKYIASEWRPPLANEGWEMYQPPLSYLLFAVVYKTSSIFASEAVSLRAIQFFSMLCGMGSAVLVFLSLRKFFPDSRGIQHFGFSVAAFLPLTIYMNPMISNEIFAAFIVSLALYSLLRYGYRKKLGFGRYLLFGLLAGLAFLSKFTGLFILLTSAYVLLLRIIGSSASRKRHFAGLVMFLLIAFAVCGWFYVRNMVVFHDPFIGNWSEDSGFHYEQHPGYRTLDFYAKLGYAFFSKPSENIWSSFWDGMYGTMWYYGNPDYRDEPILHLNTLGRTILWLALLPTVAVLLGFTQSIGSICRIAKTRSWYMSPYIPIVLLTVSTFSAIIYFTMRNPFYSTIQACFFLSLLIPISVFAGRGLQTMCENLGRFRILIYAHLSVLYCLITVVFWYNIQALQKLLQLP